MQQVYPAFIRIVTDFVTDFREKFLLEKAKLFLAKNLHMHYNK